MESSFTTEETRVSKALYAAVESQNWRQTEAILISNTRCLKLNEYPPQQNMTVLHMAVGNNSFEIVEILLKHGSDPNCQNCEGKVSPLMLSVLYDYGPIVRILVKAGGDPLIRDAENKNCLDYVIENDLTHLLIHLTAGKNDLSRFSLGVSIVSQAPVQEFQEMVTETDSFFTCSGSDGNVTLPSTAETETDEKPESGDCPVLDSSVDCPVMNCSVDCSPVPVLDSSVPISNRTSSSLSMEKGISDYSYLLTDDDTRYGTIEEIPSRKFKLLTIKENIPETPIKSFDIDTYARPTGLTPNPTFDEIQRLRVIARTLGLELPVTESTYGVISRYVASRSNLPPISCNYPASALASTPLRPINPSPAVASSSKVKSDANFSPELMYGLRTMDIILAWGSHHRLEMLQELQSHNSNSSPSRRMSKAYFNYLLLDPHVIKRANFSGNQLKADVITKNPEKFETFLRAVFYIGKGCGTRPLQHLVEAKKKLLMKKKNLSAGDKLDKVLQIWNMGQGVILHSAFHHSNEKEANANEASMIDAIGLQCESLTNLKKGSYDGTVASGWSQKVKNQYGTFLLYKAFCTFLVSDPKKFLPQDV